MISYCYASQSNRNGVKGRASAQVKYAQRMRKLTKILPTGSIKVVTPRSVPSPKSFFLIAHELYLKNPTFSKSILTSLMESMVTQMTNPTKSPKIEARTMNFCHYIANVSPQPSHISWDLPRFVATFQTLGKHERPVGGVDASICTSTAYEGA